jgi:hypothetical protein
MTTTLSLSQAECRTRIGQPRASSNHLLGAASPAFVKTGIFDQDGQVVAAPVVATVRAGWTARDVVPADLPHGTHVLQNAKVRLVRCPWSFVERRSGLSPDAGEKRCRLWTLSFPAMNVRNSSSVTFRRRLRYADLVLQRVIGAIKPKSAIGASVDSQAVHEWRCQTLRGR